MTIGTPTRLKIGINGRFLQYPYTGIGQYTIQLLREFAHMKREGRDEVHPIDFPQRALLQECVVVVPNEKCIELMRQEKIDLPAAVIPEKGWFGKSFGKHWWEQIQVSGFFHEQKVNLVWLPYPCVKWFGGKREKTVVTVHDTIPWTRREYQLGLFSRLAHWMSRRSVRRADHVITVSETSAKEIARVCEIPEERISVVENGVSALFYQPVSQDVVHEVLGRYDLSPEKFFLYVGGYDARKNVGLMVSSFKKYSELHECSYPLVLVGGKAHFDGLYSDFDDTLTDTVNSRTVSIIKTGFLDDASLVALYHTARGFVHFSSAEGFNIPLAQAMISHLPLLISDTDIHREIAGGGAVYVQPDHEASIMKGWDMLMHGDERDNSGESAERFSWKRSADSHLRIFKRILL